MIYHPLDYPNLILGIRQCDGDKVIGTQTIEAVEVCNADCCFYCSPFIFLPSCGALQPAMHARINIRCLKEHFLVLNLFETAMTKSACKLYFRTKNIA